MDKIDDGGPAFPATRYEEVEAGAPFEGTENLPVEYAGLTIRDWFAGQALAGMTSVRVDIPGCDSEADFHAKRMEILRGFAVTAYEYADAMLAARSVQP